MFFVFPPSSSITHVVSYYLLFPHPLFLSFFFFFLHLCAFVVRLLSFVVHDISPVRLFVARVCVCTATTTYIISCHHRPFLPLSLFRCPSPPSPVYLFLYDFTIHVWFKACRILYLVFCFVPFLFSVFVFAFEYSLFFLLTITILTLNLCWPPPPALSLNRLFTHTSQPLPMQATV